MRDFFEHGVFTAPNVGLICYVGLQLIYALPLYVTSIHQRPPRYTVSKGINKRIYIQNKQILTLKRIIIYENISFEINTQQTGNNSQT
jgi:hypothetical protein